MSASDPFQMSITNPNADTEDDDTSAIVYLISTRNDGTNELDLTIQNVSGNAVNFTTNTPINVSMKAVLPEDVITGIQVQNIPDGWRWSVHKVGPHAQGIELTPTSPQTLLDQKSLTFSFVSIVFTDAEVQQAQTKLGDFEVTTSVPDTRETPLKVMVTPLVTKSKLLLHFEAAFLPVPDNLGWNVSVNGAQARMNKDQDTVFSNCIPDQNILTRLAFRLTNKDANYALSLTPDSVFKVSFLPGEGYGQLANDQDLLNNIRISEIGTNDWLISQPTDEGALEWTLAPKNNPTVLGANGGSYNFLIDAVRTNGKPTIQDSVTAITEMYVLYVNVPNRTDSSQNYDDGYLAATIEKIAPTPQMVLPGMSFALQTEPGPTTLLGYQFTFDSTVLTLKNDRSATITGSVTMSQTQASAQWSAVGTWSVAPATGTDFQVTLNLTSNETNIYVDGEGKRYYIRGGYTLQFILDGSASTFQQPGMTVDPNSSIFRIVNLACSLSTDESFPPKWVDQVTLCDIGAVWTAGT